MRFFLGTTNPDWLADPRFEDVPLFVSRNRLVGHVTEGLRAKTRYALDSGAFTQIAMHGKWTVPPRQYAREAKRWQQQLGPMDFAAIMDWMAEPDMLKKTGKSVVEHQILTTRSLLELRDIEPSVPWMPILQGWEAEDYLRHVDRYERAGVDLWKEPVVGIGSVCKRQDTQEADQLALALHTMGLRTHFFGYSTHGLRRSARYLQSSDSMAWSFAARFRPVRLEECTHAYPDCQYCERWALLWRQQLLRAVRHVV